MQWFYLDVNQLQVPADESELGGLIQRGTITEETLLWNESMPEWKSAGALFPDSFVPGAASASSGESSKPAEATPGRKLVTGHSQKMGVVKRDLSAPRSSVAIEGTAQSAEEKELVKDFASYLAVNAGWIKFGAVICIIVGVANCLTIFGIIIGWLPIWVGVILLKAANSATSAQVTGYREELEESLDRLSFFFKLLGILLLLYLLFIAGLAAFAVLGGFVGMIMESGISTPS